MQALEDLKYFEAILRNKVAQETAYEESLTLLGCDRRFFRDLYQKNPTPSNQEGLGRQSSKKNTADLRNKSSQKSRHRSKKGYVKKSSVEKQNPKNSYKPRKNSKDSLGDRIKPSFSTQVLSSLHNDSIHKNTTMDTQDLEMLCSPEESTDKADWLQVSTFSKANTQPLGKNSIKQKNNIKPFISIIGSQELNSSQAKGLRHVHQTPKRKLNDSFSSSRTPVYLKTTFTHEKRSIQ